MKTTHTYFHGCCCALCMCAQSCALLWGPFPGQCIVLTPHCCVTVIVSENKLLCPSSKHTEAWCSLSLISTFPPPALWSSLLSFPSLNVSLLTANQRAGKAVDPAGGWVLWQGSRPCTGDKEMGVLGRQALPGLLSPHGQIQNVSGNSARHFFWLQQGCECTPFMTIKTESRYMWMWIWMCIPGSVHVPYAKSLHWCCKMTVEWYRHRFVWHRLL